MSIVCHIFSDDIKSMVDMELIDYEGDAETWFEGVLDETKDRLEEQKKLY